jgi:hypothetical protein
MRKRDGRPLACQQIFESYKVTGLAKEQPSFLKMNDINDISTFGTPEACAPAVRTLNK